MDGKPKLLIVVLSLAGGLGLLANENPLTEPTEESRMPAASVVANQRFSDHQIQLSEEALRAFSIKQSPNRQQSVQRDSILPKVEEKKESAPKISSIRSSKAKPAKRLNLDMVTPHGDEYSLYESDDSSICFQVTQSRDLESCSGILRRVGQSARFEGELKGVFRFDPSHQVRSAPISIELRGDQGSASVRTDYIRWDRYGYEISRRSCMFQAVCN